MYKLFIIYIYKLFINLFYRVTDQRSGYIHKYFLTIWNCMNIFRPHPATRIIFLIYTIKIYYYTIIIKNN